ncbi:MAG: thioesterase family protein [Planctomycetota bacterium]|jgi:predicted thioesterase
MNELKPGLLGEASVRVNRSNTASALGNVGVDVFATPFLVALMEEAARNAVEPLLPEGKITLGGLVELKHLAPTPLGFEIRASACLLEVKGPKLVFEVGIVDGMERVGEGRHVRFISSQDTFNQAVREKSTFRRRGP